MAQWTTIGLAACLLAGIVTAGCGEETVTIQLSYVQQPRFQIPEKIQKIAVAQFAGKTPEDQQWGVVAADKLVGELDKANAEFKRYELVDRRNLAGILQEHDVQIMNATDAAKVEEKLKIANVQAMIYGTVTVNARDERASREVLDIGSLAGRSVSTKTKYYTKRYCYVSVNLTMDDVQTSKTIKTFTLQQAFDSEKDTGSSSLGKFVGFGSDNPPPVAETVDKVLTVCVEQFIKEISPHRVNEKVKLESGESPKVETGNKLAKAGEYADALALYRQAMAEKHGDYGAVFNAAVMCEALGDMKGAYELYSKAFQMNPKKDSCLECRKRVKAEMKEEPVKEPVK